MFADPNRVHRRQQHVLVRANIASEKQGSVGTACILETTFVVWQQVAITCRQSAAFKSSQRVGSLVVRSIDHGSIDVGSDLVDLLTLTITRLVTIDVDRSIQANLDASGSRWVKPCVTSRNCDN